MEVALNECSGHWPVGSGPRSNRTSTWSGANPRLAEAMYVRDLLLARAHRGKHFKGGLFSDPAWDILLELYYAELTQKRFSVSSLGVVAGVPPTTVIRWIEALRQEDLIVRRPDPLDGRRVFIALSGAGAEAMKSYFDSLPRAAMLP
jgi:DNA-binding MarR family transcriptional regulator